MNPADIISRIEGFVKKDMEAVCSAHDRFHIDRVRTLAKQLYNEIQQGDPLVIELGALLHESFDEKFFGNEDIGARKETLRKLLISMELEETQVEQILFILDTIGFGKSLERDHDIILPLEFQIVEDADRLESIGAIAIARTFAYGGKKGRDIYNPDFPVEEITRETYRNRNRNNTSSINHFYEKLLLLKDLIHTAPAKRLAQQRHEFMEHYLDQFFKERDCLI